MNAWEVNFDGLVGLTHHYAGLSFGNEASTRHRFQVSNPRLARSADGSVGSPHARVGNCQASNKTKGSVGRLGLSFYLLFVGERSPE